MEISRNDLLPLSSPSERDSMFSFVHSQLHIMKHAHVASTSKQGAAGDGHWSETVLTYGEIGQQRN